MDVESCLQTLYRDRIDVHTYISLDKVFIKGSGYQNTWITEPDLTENRVVQVRLKCMILTVSALSAPAYAVRRILH